MSVVFHTNYLDHRQWQGHPESPYRLVSAIDKMMKWGIWGDVVVPEPATREDLLLVHDEGLVDRVEGSENRYLDPDTYVHRETYDIALLAAGGTVEAARRCLDGVPILAMVRPPGHHAGRDFSGGFCYFNNGGVAIEKLGKRTAIVDLDVHHGNGTQSIYYDSDEVLYISTHQYGTYPGTGKEGECGAGAGEGYTVNLPFSGGTGDSSFLYAFERVIEPILRLFEPELLLIDLGVDAHYKDPLASLALSSPGYLELCRRLLQIPSQGSFFLLEGGYHLDSTGEVIAGLAASLMGETVELRYNDSPDTGVCSRETVDRVADLQRAYWDLE